MRKHISFYYALKLVTGIFSLTAIVFFVKYAGRAVYGEYALIVSVVFALNNGLSGWLNQIILKYFNKEGNNLNLKTFILKALLVSLLLGIIILEIYFRNFHFLQQLYLLLSFVGIFLFSILTTFYQKLYQFRTLTIVEVVRASVLLGIPVVFILRYEKVLSLLILIIGFSLSYIVPVLITAITGVFKKKRVLETLKKIKLTKLKKKTIKIYLSYGIPIGLWLGIATSLNVVDRYLIEYYFTFDEVGVYSSIYDITYKISTFTLTPILTAIHPLIMNAYNKKSTDYKLIILRAVKLQTRLLPALVLLICGISIFSDMILGVEMTSFITISLPVLLGAFLWNLAMVYHKILEIKNRTMKMLFYITIALLVNIIGNILFLPILGYQVAAYTTILSFLTYILLVKYSLKRIGYD